MKLFPYFFLIAAFLTSSSFVQADCANPLDNNPCEGNGGCEKDECSDGAVSDNPIQANRGSLLRDVTDLKIFGPGAFEFTRTYNSRPRNYTLPRWTFGTSQTWQHNWQYELLEHNQLSNGLPVMIVRYPQGAEKYFYAADSSGSVYVSDAFWSDRLYPTGVLGQYRLRSKNGKELLFSKDITLPNTYLLNQVSDGKGSIWSLTYQFLASRNRLTRISNNYGQFININGSKRPESNFWAINSIQSSDGRTVSYNYSMWAPTSTHVLTSVNYPDSTSSQYSWCGHISLTTGEPLLASASDPTYTGPGARSSYIYHYGGTYALKGTILKELHTDTGETNIEFPNGAGRNALILEGGQHPIVRRFVLSNLVESRDAMGRTTTHTYQTVGGVANAGFLISTKDPAGATTTYTRDAVGRTLSETNALGAVTSYTYSPAGFLLTTTDPLGRVTTHTRDANNFITRTDHPDGTFEAFTYNSSGQTLTHRLRNGATESFTYTSGNLTSQTDAAGNVTTHTYLTNGLRGTTTNALGHTTSFQYDWQGRLTKITHPDGSFRTTAYDSMGNVSMQADEMLNITTYTYDTRNRMASMTDPLDRVTTYTYGQIASSCGSCSSNGSSTPLTITYPDGSVTRNTFDLSGKLLTTTKNDATSYAATTTQVYDPAGRIQTITDALGTGVTTFSYDILSRKISSKDPLNRTTTFTYDAVGNLLTQTAPDGSVITRTYDSMDRLATSKDPLNHTTTYTYNVPGRTSSVTDALGRTTTTTTDALGRTISQQNATGATSISTYDAADRLISSTDALGHVTTYAYNSRGHLLSSTDPLGNTTVNEVDALGRTTATITAAPLSLRTDFSYDPVGNLLSTKRPDGQFITKEYDSMNRPTKLTEPQSPQNHVTLYSYHPTGTLHTLTDPKGQVTTWIYDKLLRLTQKLYANGNAHSYTYNLAGELLTHTTPKNEIASHTYNLKGQLLSQTWNTSTPATTYTYYADGQTASITHGTSAIQYAYDAAHQLTAETQSLSGLPNLAIQSTHDLAGRRLNSTYSAGRVVKYAWTARGQLASVELDGPPPFAHYHYDAAGRLTSLAHENGITETLSYDTNHRLLARNHLNGSTPVSGHSYTLDNLSRRTAENFVNNTTPARSYGYDPLGQVTSATYGSGQSDSYAYDKAGNRSSASLATAPTASPITYTTNNANQYTTITGVPVPITYDANGNLTEQNNNTYTWDSHNRLLSVVPISPAIGAKALHYSYDGLHRRILRQIREWTGSSWINLDTTRFLYDAWNVVEEHKVIGSTQTLARARTWGSDLSGSLQGAGGVGGLLLTEEFTGGSTAAYHHHYDGNGNVTEITDLTGTSAARYRYDAFGNTLVSTGSYASENRYRFSTKPLDAEVASAPLYYYGYRYYDPATGRWPSRDPIEEEGGVNLYGFVGNKGLNKWDYLGLAEESQKCPPEGSTRENCTPEGKKMCNFTDDNMSFSASTTESGEVTLKPVPWGEAKGGISSTGGTAGTVRPGKCVQAYKCQDQVCKCYKGRGTTHYKWTNTGVPWIEFRSSVK